MTLFLLDKEKRLIRFISENINVVVNQTYNYYQILDSFLLILILVNYNY